MDTLQRFNILLVMAILCTSGFFALATDSAAVLPSFKKWFILLDYDPSVSGFKSQEALSYQMAIFDPDNHPPLEELQHQLTLIAYLSLGQAADYRWWWPQIANKPWVLAQDKDWPGDYNIDIRQEAWQNLLIDQIIPKMIAQGFQGLMLDTLDVAEQLEESDPDKFQGAQRAMAELVKKIHQRYPKLYLISNNGFAILPQIAPYLSAMLVEDINMMVDFKNNGYAPTTTQDREYKLNIIQEIRKVYHIPVFNIDYVGPKQVKLAYACLAKSRALGFNPYIAQKNLNAIYHYSEE